MDPFLLTISYSLGSNAVDNLTRSSCLARSPSPTCQYQFFTFQMNTATVKPLGDFNMTRLMEGNVSGNVSNVLKDVTLENLLEYLFAAFESNSQSTTTQNNTVW
ncbi:hypothetical protein CHS0354_004565 [Potamilus streckersoni]|uniref:Uncharacterized protein n=1 Tax=Potamilus streckersoni TaxID=2493646 RepID=A0AAE0VQU5_9BIVA|nr:hypothetical protein CHS0354_004565 [Potamilus streckersoni]